MDASQIYTDSDSILAVNPPATLYMGKDKVESECQVVL